MTTENFDLVPADVPEYAMSTALSTEMAAEMFDDALSGLSMGYPPSIRTSNGRFKLVDSAGEESPVAPKHMVDGEYLPVIILRAKRELSKAYYAKAYDPNQGEGVAPDCWSLDAVKPDASVATPVHTNCASCPMNAFGSGKNQNGEPTAGKACTDAKILAVLNVHDNSIYSLKVSPASLRNLAGYFSALKNRRVAPGSAVTYVGFDTSKDYTVLTFHAGKFIPEQMMADLAARSETPEVQQIINPIKGVATAEEAKPQPQEAAGEKQPVEEQADEQVQVEVVTKPKAKAKAKAKTVVVEPEPEVEEAGDAISDGDLAGILGFGSAD